ncbi:MAG TPA: hypothetical protein VNJ11_09250 [Bryobacteraceae bacterium]|nr:hypothetical protein [Bryobacteraceae bacterium]
MRRRSVLAGLILLPLAAAQSKLSLRGRLIQAEGRPPVLDTRGHGPVELKGDEATLAVLNDRRLAGADFEVVGHFEGPRRFLVEPIHTKAMFVHKNGKRYLISYWCETCAIRAYRPGLCMCCREEMALDLQEYGEK